jgi:hypothetical protein
MVLLALARRGRRRVREVSLSLTREISCLKEVGPYYWAEV